MCYFGLFAVNPLQQGTGIGKLILAEAERAAKQELGSKVMEVFSIGERVELVDWYERRGYKEVMRAPPGHWGVAITEDVSFARLVKDL